MCQSSFHGKIAEIPGISVDNFEDLDDIKPRAYFLSHCHTDHTKGLTQNGPLLKTLERTKSCIYMSELTAAVINYDTNYVFEEYVKVLKPGRRPITLPADPENNLNELCIDVTMVPAGHSFGSVMFIFHTNDKTILFTGDFRITVNDVSKYAYLHNPLTLEPIKIDVMYVDTTFFDARYEYFPKRSESIECVVDIIKDWLEKDSDNRIALHTSAKFGYEAVFIDIHKKLGHKVYVNGARWNFYRSLQKDIVPSVTNDITESKIHICANWSEKAPHTKCHSELTDKYNYLFLHFSAMKWGFYNLGDKVYNEVSDKRIDVCFATHCSRSELVHFIKYLNPGRVEGFVEEYRQSPIKTVEKIKLEGRRKRKASPNKNVTVDRKVDTELVRKIFEF